jgi:hypothetical protein
MVRSQRPASPKRDHLPQTRPHAEDFTYTQQSNSLGQAAFSVRNNQRELISIARLY